MNLKQEEIIEDLMALIKRRYPEVELTSVQKSPESSTTLWIEVTAPEDEDRCIEMREFASDRLADIQLDYGYHMLIMPIPKKETEAV
jgi:hypothetical protein